MSTGPPMCTLDPLHAGALPQTTDWKSLFEISFTRINQNQLVDFENVSGYVDGSTNGWFVVIEPIENLDKPEQIEIKGFSIQVVGESENGHDLVEFPLLHKNQRVKKLDCYDETIMLSHKDATPKKRISFFFKGHPDYLTSNKKLFKVTILGSYLKYWSGITF